MRIGIDATLFINNNQTGIPRSVYEILKVWMSDFKENEYFLFSNKEITLDEKLPENWHVVVSQCFINKGRLWRAFRLPKDIVEQKIDVFWGTLYWLPRKKKGIEYIVTIYDLALFKFRNIGNPKAERIIKYDTKLACKRASKIVAISKATAEDIHSILNVPYKKIETSYCGGLPSGYVVNNQTKKETSKKKQLLFIGTIEPRKNIITIIKAFELYKEKTMHDTVLVLAGKRGWRCEEIYDAVEHSKYRDDIEMPGFITDEEKHSLLNEADAFVYPSLYEGFGIPILEAFAYNLPVITTRISSMPEVAGDAGYYIEEARNVQQLANQMSCVLNASDEEREKNMEKMKEQLDKFSWRKNAIEMMNILSEAVNG